MSVPGCVCVNLSAICLVCGLCGGIYIIFCIKSARVFVCAAKGSEAGDGWIGQGSEYGQGTAS